MPYKLHFDGKDLYRGKKLIESTKFKDALRNDKSKCRNGKERAVFTALAVVKHLSGVGRCPFVGKSKFVKESLLTVELYLSKNASTALRDGMEELLCRSKSAHSKLWAENCHSFFTEIAAVIVQSRFPSTVAVVTKSDLRLTTVKCVLHRVSIYSTGFQEASWRDCFCFAVGTSQARDLETLAPHDLKFTTKVKDFISAGILYVVTGVDSGFFERASTLCRERKVEMNRIVGSHEQLIERLFTRIANADVDKQDCISHLSDALRKRDKEIEMLRAQLKIKESPKSDIPHAHADVPQAIPSELMGSRASSSSLSNDAKITTEEELEDGEILTDSDSEMTLTMMDLPPIPALVKNPRQFQRPYISFNINNQNQNDYMNNYGCQTQHQQYVRSFQDAQQFPGHPQSLQTNAYSTVPQTGFIAYTVPKEQLDTSGSHYQHEAVTNVPTSKHLVEYQPGTNTNSEINLSSYYRNISNYPNRNITYGRGQYSHNRNNRSTYGHGSYQPY